jgi:hypothetical protein
MIESLKPSRIARILVGVVRHRAEPEASWMRRFVVWVMARLPVEEFL